MLRGLKARTGELDLTRSQNALNWKGPAWSVHPYLKNQEGRERKEFCEEFSTVSRKRWSSADLEFRCCESFPWPPVH